MSVTDVHAFDYVGDGIRLIITAQCPRESEGCEGTATFECKFENSESESPTFKWVDDRQEQCEQCGVVFGLTAEMLGHVTTEARKQIAEKGLGNGKADG